MLNQQPHGKQRVLATKTYNIGWIEGDVIRKKNCLNFFGTTKGNAMAAKGKQYIYIYIYLIAFYELL